MSEQELAQGFGFNLTAVPVLAEPNQPYKLTGISRELESVGEARESTVESRYATSEFITDSCGGSTKLCGKPRRMGVRQGKRGAAGEHGCSLAAPKSFPVPVPAELSSPSLPEKVESRGEAREAPSDHVKDSRGGENSLSGGGNGSAGQAVRAVEGVIRGNAGTGARALPDSVAAAQTFNDVHSNSFESKLDPFFSSKHKIKEAWRPRKPSYWLDMCGRRHK